MSVVFELKEDFSNLPLIVERYEQALADFHTDVNLKGKTIGTANSENPSLLAYYDERRAEVKILLDMTAARLERVKGELWKRYTENHSRDLGPKDKDYYIKCEPEYAKVHKLLLCVQELHSKYVAAVDAFVARGFSLRNITNLRVAQVENGLIT